MNRNHIHFAPDVPGGQEIISGRSVCCVVIWCNVCMYVVCACM